MKHLVFIILIIITPPTLTSQVIFDFSKMEDLDSKELKKQIEPVKNGEIVLIKIENINTFLYKVEIDGKQIELQTPIPSELQTLFRLSTEELESGAEEAEEGAEESYSALGAMEKLNNNAATTPALKTELPKLIKECHDYIDEIEKLVSDIAEVKFARMQLITYAKEDLKFSEMRNKLSFINIPNDVTLKQTYKDFQTLYHKVELLYEKVKGLGTAAEDAIISNALEKIEEGYEKIESENVLSIIEDVITLKIGLENKKNFMVISPPIHMEGDMVSYEVTITPTRTNNLAAYKNPVSWQVNIPAKGGWKADFSVGPVLSFGNNSRDEKFYTEVTEVDTMITLRQRDNGNAINPSLAAMMHFYPRTGKYTSYGFNFGVGAGFQSTDDVDLTIFLGGSLILGKSRKIMVSAGAGFLKVDRLKNPQFEVGQVYNINGFDVTNVVEKVFKSSPYISITYNISNRVEIN